MSVYSYSETFCPTFAFAFSCQKWLVIVIPKLDGNAIFLIDANLLSRALKINMFLTFKKNIQKTLNWSEIVFILRRSFTGTSKKYVTLLVEKWSFEVSPNITCDRKYLQKLIWLHKTRVLELKWSIDPIKAGV